MAQEREVKKKLESEERKDPYNTLNRSEQHRTTTEWKNGDRREKGRKETLLREGAL